MLIEFLLCQMMGVQANPPKKDSPNCQRMMVVLQVLFHPVCALLVL